MSDASSHHQRLQAEQDRVRELSGRLRAADAATPELFFDVIRDACWRFHSIPRVEYRSRVERLIQIGAWTDAALGLLELELPLWQLRRIAYDAGEWCCALSHQRELPDWLDQSIEACHADLPLAILSAFIDAQYVQACSARTSVPGAPRTERALYVRLCCDNFV